MSDLIRRQDAIDAVHKEFDEVCVWDESGQTTANEVENILYEVPSAEPVRKAKVMKHKYWLDVSLNVVGEQTIGYEWLCENCKKKVIDGDDYCSHCGARLEWE